MYLSFCMHLDIKYCLLTLFGKLYERGDWKNALNKQPNHRIPPIISHSFDVNEKHEVSYFANVPH